MQPNIYRQLRQVCHHGSATAFTLIELLVVIAIIAVISGLLMTAGPGVYAKRDKARVQASMKKIEMAINDYKEYYGAYPLSHTNPTAANLAHNSLFYELAGVELLPNPAPLNQPNPNWQYRSLEDNSFIFPNVFSSTFGQDGIMNVTHRQTRSKSFMDMKSSDYATLSSTLGDYKVLVGPAKPTATSGLTNSNNPRIVANPWRYNAINPTNRPGEFDLWLEFNAGGKNTTNGNWDR